METATYSPTMDKQGEISTLGGLPADVLSLILCHLSPRDVAMAACVSRAFRGASAFDSVWESVALSHLGSKYREILALDPAVRLIASKREVFEYLCSRRVLFADHTQGFWLERGTGRMCLGIGARAMYIEHGENPRYWNWLSDHHNSLFPEVAQLKEVCFFEVKGETHCTLPPGTYTLSFRLRFSNLRNWGVKPVTFRMCKNDVDVEERKCYIDPRGADDEAGLRLPTVRAVEHGWREYDVGEFQVAPGEVSSLLKFSMTAVEVGQPWKSGLFLDGVVVRNSLSLRESVPESRESFIRFLQMNELPRYRIGTPRMYLGLRA